MLAVRAEKVAAATPAWGEAMTRATQALRPLVVGMRTREVAADATAITLDPTGVIRVRRGAHLTVAAVFRSWGRTLRRDRMLSFHGRVRAYVDGRRWTRSSVSAIPLRRHAEIVLEVGPHVPPHRLYHFPPGT